MTAETLEAQFQAGLARYRAGEPAADLIPLFKRLGDAQPKVASVWICLAWLYLLDAQAERALSAAKRAVKLSPEDPQAQINLAIAMLDTSQKGVRQHVEIAQHCLMAMQDVRAEIVENFEEGMRRRPGWASLEKVRKWVLGEDT